MNRGQIKTLFRRRVHDVDGIQWSDAEQNDLVNLAYSKVQKEIFKHRRDAHLFWDYINTAAGVSWYPLPATFGVRRVGLAESVAVPMSYAKLPCKAYEDIVELSTGATRACYTLMGQWLGIFPAPASVVAAGIEVIHTPVMTLAADADVPRIKLPLHDAIPIWAAIIAKGETDEDTTRDKEDLGAILGDLGDWYQIDSDSIDQFQVVGVG